MATNASGAPLIEGVIRVSFDDARAARVVRCGSIQDMIAAEALVAGNRCSTPEGMFEIVDSQGLSANGSTVLDLSRGSTVAVLLPDQLLDDVESLLEDTRPARWFRRGLRINTRSGFSYRIAADDASDHHLTTKGGVKLYVMPLGAGGYAAAAFGVDDGGADPSAAALNTARLQMAIDTAWREGRGHVQLGRATYITTIDLRPGVVLVGGSSTADVGAPAVFGGYRTGSGSWLIQANGTNGPAVRHMRQSYAGDAAPEMARGLGLRNVLITTQGGAWSETDHPVGVQFENCVFLVWEKVFVQGFRTNVLLRECWDSTFIDLRTGPGDYGLRIDNFGDTDNSNNLKFLHARLESWKRGGIQIVSGGGAPFQNNKIDFYSLKNEGHPDQNGESCICIDGNSEIRFIGGYSSIFRRSTPPMSFKLLDLRAEKAESIDIEFHHFGLATNGYPGTIDSVVSVAPTTRNIRSMELDLSIAVNGGTTLTNGVIAFARGSYQAIDVNLRYLYNPGKQAVFTGLANVPQTQRAIRLPDRSFYEYLAIRHPDATAAIHLEQESTGHAWELRTKSDGGLGVFLDGTETASFTANGGLVLAQERLAIADALGLRALKAAPTTLGEGITLAVANGSSWDPASVGSGPYLVAWTGVAWRKLSWS